jgi:hypothetical protein
MKDLVIEESRFAAIDIERMYKDAPLPPTPKDIKQALQQPIMTTKFTMQQSESSKSSEAMDNDSDRSNFFENSPLSVDAMLKYVVKLSFFQIASMLLYKMPTIINAFYISLAGYNGLETFENTQAMIKGIGLGNIIVQLCFGVTQGINGALETLVSHAFGCSLLTQESEIFRTEMRK